MRVYPSYRYHKEHGSKIIHSDEEHEEHSENGWVDSPAKVNDAPTANENENPEGEEGKSDSSDIDENVLDADLSGKSVKELKAILKKMGCPDEELKGKDMAELIHLIQG